MNDQSDAATSDANASANTNASDAAPTTDASSTSSSGANANPPKPFPELNTTQEVRFAVVMYGGVSLAIYINGIAQELLRMTRATAEAGSDGGQRVMLSGARAGAVSSNAKTRANHLTGTERVYRKLSYLLANKNLKQQYKEYVEREAQTGARQAGTGDAQPTTQANIEDPLERAVEENSLPVTTRFIVDILSGTSAGGINAIHLSKALTNDLKIDELKKLWISEGDIALLINDRHSLAEIKLAPQNPPQSLLNSRRMYLKLLRSFEDMDEGAGHSSNSSNGSHAGNGDRRNDSPFVDELDLFITTTDLEGVPLPIRLFDTVVYERRHRNVFHLKYRKQETSGEERNDFVRAYNPFLAFAARCTSSFPFAFEPMRLCDIDPVLQSDFPHLHSTPAARADSQLWQPFFEENLNPALGADAKTDHYVPKVEFSKRAFGDGGYLDNKPFSYATQTLIHRQAAVPVDRKLIYIEPSPEHPEDTVLQNTNPDALSNVKLALLDLPAYETIREDLQIVLQRNRLINRVNRIIEDIERDVELSEQSDVPDDQKNYRAPDLKRGAWREMDMAEMTARYGPYFIPYRRLRIAAVTDDLTNLVARIKNFDENSDHFMAIRYLIHAWRVSNYFVNRNENHECDKKIERSFRPTETLNAFLDDFDFNYRLRRINFIRKKIDHLYMLANSLPNEASEAARYTDKSEMKRDQCEFISLLEKHGLDYFKLGMAERLRLPKDIAAVFFYLKCQLNEIYKDLRAGLSLLNSRSPVKREALGQSNAAQRDSLLDAIENFRNTVREIHLSADQLNILLRGPDAIDRTNGNSEAANMKQKTNATASAKQWLAAEQDYSTVDERAAEEFANYTYASSGIAESFDKAANALRAIFNEQLVRPTSDRCRQLLDSQAELIAPTNPRCQSAFEIASNLDTRYVEAIRKYLQHYFVRFDDYDQISFPILYDTEVGEADVVEIIRISPEDATSIINERKESRSGSTRRKLAGTALFHFGAFLDRVWRQNDIMWGRLDGAERLITAMLPNEKNKVVRRALIEEAQTAILAEEIPQESRLQLSGLMSDALMRASSGLPIEEAIRKVLQEMKDASPVQKQLESVMRNSLQDEALLSFMKEGYEVNRKLDPQGMLKAMSRSTQVIGHIFEHIAEQNGQDRKSVAWIARLGQVFWGLVQVAVPGSLLNLFFIHWLKVLYVFEVVLFIGAWILSTPETEKFALTALFVTAGINLLVFVLHDMMRMKKGWRFTILTVFVILVVVLAAIGGLDVYEKILAKNITPQHVLSYVKARLSR